MSQLRSAELLMVVRSRVIARQVRELFESDAGVQEAYGTDSKWVMEMTDERLAEITESVTGPIADEKGDLRIVVAWLLKEDDWMASPEAVRCVA